MDINVEVRELKKLVVNLTTNVSAARAEHQALVFAFEALAAEVQRENPQMLDRFKNTLNGHLL